MRNDKSEDTMEFEGDWFCLLHFNHSGFFIERIVYNAYERDIERDQRVRPESERMRDRHTDFVALLR